MENLLFVYGTLKEKGRNHKLIKGKFLSKRKAITYGKMFHLINENYPAMIEGNDIIYGEVYELAEFDKQIKKIDHLENFDKNNTENSEYIRSNICIYFENGEKVCADTYIYNKKLLNNKNSNYIPIGKWKELKEKLVEII